MEYITLDNANGDNNAGTRAVVSCSFLGVGVICRRHAYDNCSYHTHTGIFRLLSRQMQRIPVICNAYSIYFHTNFY